MSSDRFIRDITFYSPTLHKTLNFGVLENDSKEGIYLIMFRLLKRDDNVIIYNYIYYPEIFVNSMLAYLIVRSEYDTSFVYRDWGDFHCLLDKSLGDDSDPVIKELKDRSFEFNERAISYKNSEDYILNKKYNSQGVNSIQFNLDSLKVHTFIQDIDCLLMYLDNYIKKRYDKVFTDLYGGGEARSDGKSWSEHFSGLMSPEVKEIYFIKDCLVVVKDKDNFISRLKEKGYKLHKGYKEMTYQLNTMSGFLYGIDSDFRYSLYKHQILKVQDNILSPQFKLPKTKFSFTNIHYNIIKGMRYYSTVRTLDKNSLSDNIQNSSLKNRQQLFEENYRLVGDILEKNYYIGSKDVQESIEKTLLNQENLFSSNNISEYKWNFNEDTYEYINNVRIKLNKLLLHPDDNDSISSSHYSSEFVPFYKLIIAKLGVDITSDLLLSYFLEILSKETVSLEDKETAGIPTITAFSKFGHKIIDKFIYKSFTKSEIFLNGGSLSEYKVEFNKLFSHIYKNENYAAIIGGYFVWNLVVMDMLTQALDTHPEIKKDTIYYLRVTDSARNIFIKYKCMVFHVPQKLPMVCEPKDYVYSLDNPKVNKLGGYLLNDVYYTSSLIKPRIGYDKQTELRPKNIVVSMVNGLSKTPYKINTDTLEYIYAYGIEKNILIDDSDPEIQSFRMNPYKSNNKKYNEKYRSIISKIIMERNILSIADIYSKVDKIYFPLRLDFRTRIYCQTDHFDYQKSDLAKGLILFANPGIINKYDEEVIKYFKAYGANMYGNNLDKKSLNYRVKWIDENSDALLNFENNDIVNKAENKVCFISFCFEYKHFIDFMNNNDKMAFHTYLPIQLDATCNGYQHLALLTHETKLLSKLNLDVSTHDDDPNDYYSYVANINKEYIKSSIKNLSLEISKSLKDLRKLDKDLNKVSIINGYKELINKVDEMLNSDSLKDIEVSSFKKKIEREIKKLEREPKEIKILLTKVEKQVKEFNSLIKLDKLNLGRSIIKKILMRQSYSAQLPTLVNNVLSDESIIELEKTDEKIYYKYINSDLIFTRHDIAMYVKSLMTLIRILAPKIDALSKYLNSMVSICTRLKMPIPWLLPSGADVAESYLVEEEDKVAAFTFTKAKYTFKIYLPGEYDVKKQRRAIRPNLIHSLDASTIAILYQYLDKDLYTVHDCFAVTANNIPLLMYKLKMVYIRLYSTNSYLLDFDNTVRFNINKIYKDKVFKINDKYINMPDTKKSESFPDVNEIINLYEDNKRIDRLTKSSYLLV